MSGDEGNRTVFKPSPLQALKEGGPPPALKSTPGRPVKAAAAPPAAPVVPPPATAEEKTLPPRQPELSPAAPSDTSATPRQVQAPPPVNGERRSSRKDRRSPARTVSFWVWAAIGAAVVAVILYLLFRNSGSV